MSYAFSGPTLSGLIPSVAGAIVIGGVYSTIAKTSLEPISLLVSRSIIDFMAYNWVKNTNLETDARKNAKIYAFTNLTVNLATLVFFRQAHLIGAIGALFFLTLMGMELYFKCLNFPKYQHR